MSGLAEKLKVALEPVLRKVELGTTDRPRKEPRLDVAFQRAQDRAGAGELPTDGIRGGSSHPTEADERKESDRVKRQAEKDAWDISTIVARMVADARALTVIAARQVELISESKRDTDALPGCKSCGRKETLGDLKLGPHWAGVTEKAPDSGLCRQCNDFRIATGSIPPMMWCHLRHTKGGPHANRWLAKEFPNLKKSVDLKAKGKPSITADDLELAEGLIVSHPDDTVAA